MYIHETKVRVRYSETDQMGYMYHGNYATLLDVARTEMLREQGLSYLELENMGIIMPVLELNVKYHKPIFYDDELTIRTMLKSAPTVRIHFDYEIYNQNQVLVTTAFVKLAFLNLNSRRPCLPPQKFFDIIQNIL